MQAWHLRERPYRKDINAWNPSRKLGSAERRTLPLRFLSFSSCRDSLSPQCDDRVCTTTLRYRKIKPRWLERNRPTNKKDNNFTSRKTTLPVAVKGFSKNIQNRFCLKENKKKYASFFKCDHVDEKKITMSTIIELCITVSKSNI